MRLIPRPTVSKRPRWKLLVAAALLVLVHPWPPTGLTQAPLNSLASSNAFAHGFNANHVRIVRAPASGKYRVIISYTHVEIGEYREAFADFTTKQEAIDFYQQLAQGADFFLGDVSKSVHFHTPPARNAPF